MGKKKRKKSREKPPYCTYERCRRQILVTEKIMIFEDGSTMHLGCARVCKAQKEQRPYELDTTRQFTVIVSPSDAKFLTDSLNQANRNL